MNEEVTQSASGAAAARAEVRVKPLSDNAFLAFFQKIWRWWLGVWYGFADKHPKGSSILYKVFFFIVFSEGVTIFQYLCYTFLPYAFGQDMAEIAWMWPGIELPWGGSWTIIGYDVARNTAGEIIIGGGLGYTISFWIGSFLAQCINFPLQRNITYKSKGNPWWQAMWYLIGWVLITFATSAINSLWLPLAQEYLPGPVYQILNTVAVGGISMVIFFFIFMVIFPDQQKAAKNAQKKAEALKASGASEETVKAAELNAVVKAEAAKLDTARKDRISAESVANVRAVSWDASKKLLEKMKAEGKPEEEIEKQENIVADKYSQALEAAVKRDEAIAANEAAIREVEAARAARA